MKQLLLLCSFLCSALLSFAQIDLDYQEPHRDIMKLADAKLPPNTIVDRNGEMAVMLYRNQFKSIEELSEKEMRLGGLRINPATNVGSRTNFSNKLSVYNLKKQKEIDVTGLPENPRLAHFIWSPDQTKMAFTNTTSDGARVYVLDIKTATVTKLSDEMVNANMGRPMRWFKDGSALLISFLVPDRGALIDTDKAIPSGPTISVNDGARAQNRTYQDLLKNKNDEHNFELLATSLLKKVSLDGTTTDWMGAGMYRGVSFSPDGEYVMLSQVKRPFSYIVPYYRFPFTTSIYTKDGKLVETVLDCPLEEERPKGFMSVRSGRRNFGWRSDKAAILTYAVALDDGDGNKEVPYRDAVYQLEAPFDGDGVKMLETRLRFGGISWGNDEVAVAQAYWWPTRRTESYLFNPSNPSQKPTAFFDRDYQDRYNDPGSFITMPNKYDRNVLFIKDNKLFLEGAGVSPEGIMPFIDEFFIQTQMTQRIWRAKKSDKLESITRVLDMEEGKILERIESKTEFPNYYVRNIFSDKAPKQVTNFENPFDAMQNVHKEVITYKREDGLPLSATLYLPPSYNKESGHKLPMIMWAYPQEFKDKASAGQVTASENEFTFPWYGSPLFWVMRGYAVLDDAAFPIVGEGDDEPNDTFIPQLVSNAKAAIDAVDSMGYIDRNRVGVGGHSYGAFMTANLLTHSDLFKAGIARSGAYNRTLTPFGFQSEERNYWEAPNVYYDMGPFMHADKMKHALLLIHGAADNNSGTYPMQSERYFNALKGLGATVRLVMLPKESHGYRARESILHMLWEQDQWLEKYVKNAE